MNTKQVLAAFIFGLSIASAHAQVTSSPLNLKLPPGSVPATSSSTAATATTDSASQGDNASHATGSRPSTAPAATDAPRTPRPAPGVYYGDTSGRTSADDEAEARPRCDDATYNQPQVHGSVGMGVVTGNHWGSGTYNSGAVNITQRTGSCDHPTGGVGLSIGVSRFNRH